MYHTPRKTINIIGPVLALVLIVSGAAASSRYDTAGVHDGRGAMATRSAAKGAPTGLNERGLIAYWWNDGSCHGYPDVMTIYAVELDGSGNVVEYRNAGATSGTDSCGVYREGWHNQSAYTWAEGQWITGVVQGDPNGSTTEHP